MEKKEEMKAGRLFCVIYIAGIIYGVIYIGLISLGLALISHYSSLAFSILSFLMLILSIIGLAGLTYRYTLYKRQVALLEHLQLKFDKKVA